MELNLGRGWNACRTTCCAIVLAPTLAAPAWAYNSEEHKVMGDWAASEVRLDTSIRLPSSTTDPLAGFQPLPASYLNAYTNAKNLAVGFGTNHSTDFRDTKKKVQDNSYPPGSSFAQLDGNLKLWIPEGSILQDFPAASANGLFVLGYPANVARSFTFGDLIALYGDYRRTTSCQDGACYLTHANTTEVSFKQGWDCYIAGQIGAPDGSDGFPLFADCGWRPNVLSTSVYLQRISAGLWPPFHNLGGALNNTAVNETDYFEAGWWGDEMMRIATTNDWHFSSAAVAWYVGMHRLALKYVEMARTQDAKYWTHALHYEANALHSLTDLFAFGHVVTNRDETSHGIMDKNSLTGTTTYRLMEGILGQGGGQRSPANGRISFAGLPALDPTLDLGHGRNDFLPSYVFYAPTWAPWAIAEKNYHSQFNDSGATVRNLRGDTFFIYGDEKLRDMSSDDRKVMKEAIRVSLRSLFDAYVKLDQYGATIDSIGDQGSDYFAALRYIPVFVKSHTGGYFTGRWTRYAKAIDTIAGVGRVPANWSNCQIPYINGGENLPGPSGACTSFPAVAVNPPAEPVLVAPVNGTANVPQSAVFQWKRSAGNAVVYDLVVCTDPAFPASCGTNFVIPPPASPVAKASGMGLVLLAATLGAGMRRRRILVALALVLSAAMAQVSCSSGDGGSGGSGSNGSGSNGSGGGGTTDVVHTVNNLQAATTYYWKVVANDADGGSTESATRSFVTR